MLIQMSEQLNITEEEKTELTNHLATFLLKLPPAYLKEDPVTIFTWWNRNIKKPEWMEVKAANDLNFVAGVYEFIDRYRHSVDKLQAREECLPRLKSRQELKAARKLLEELGVRNALGRDVYELLEKRFWQEEKGTQWAKS